MVNQTRPILLAEDDADLREVLTRALTVEGFDVTAVGRGDAVLEAVRTQTPALLLLDLGLPAMPGLEVLKALRGSGDLPIIIISGRDDESDKVLGLELGADDYITKPVQPRELAARIRSVLRRSTPVVTADRTTLGPVTIDRSTREAEVRGAEIDLTAKEFDLLAFLMSSPRQVFSRQQLLDAVWGDTSYRDPATVTEHVRRLRLKVERDPGAPTLLTTVRGVGYRCEDREDDHRDLP